MSDHTGRNELRNNSKVWLKDGPEDSTTHLIATRIISSEISGELGWNKGFRRLGKVRPFVIDIIVIQPSKCSMVLTSTVLDRAFQPAVLVFLWDVGNLFT